MGIASDLVLVVLAGLVGGLVAYRFGQPLLIGYILGGVLVGPHMPGPTVSDIHNVELLAEIGVALLLFALGLELRFSDLAPVRRLALIGGPIQVLLTAAAGYLFFVFALGWDLGPALWMGAMISLSSTMVVLKILMSQGRTASLPGRAMIGLLVVQDLAVVPMLVALPFLGDIGRALPQLGGALLQATLFLAAMILVGTRLMPFLLGRIVRWGSRELFLISVVALGVGIGYGTYLFGLSFAFGSFVAGMVLSESEFSHQALGEIVPLRDVFGLLFFASAGMLLDPTYLIDNPVVVVASVLFVVVVKALICGGVTRALGYGGPTPWLVGLGLAQVGEFSFLIARTGAGTGALSRDEYGMALVLTLVTMVLSPTLSRLGDTFYAAWLRLRPQHVRVETYHVPEDIEDHVVVVGFGRSGKAASTVMRQVGVPFIVIEFDHNLVAAAREQGLATVWGDASHAEVLEAAGVRRARMMLVAVSDAVSGRMAVEKARALNPELRIVARALYPEHLGELANLGVYQAVQPEMEAGLEMVRQILSGYGTPVEDVRRFTEAVRDDLYGPLWEGGLSARYHSILEELGHERDAVVIEWFVVPRGPVEVTRTIRELEVRNATGAVVVAIIHGRVVDPRPGPESEIHGGDRVALLGAAEERVAARELITTALSGAGAVADRPPA
ncbi:MAG TPA: cation:proton antiporter [Gemmatimonadota bacterium]|nr:cation:proton antiporter [Gemmatimonadota bacterium]